MGLDVAVVGAGIVGMSAALYLQRDGHNVAVTDPNAPGDGASFGNSGSIATASALPIVTGSVLRRVPAMLRDPYGPLVLRPSYLIQAMPWLMRVALATRRARVDQTTHALGRLLDLAEGAFEPLVSASHAHHLLRRTGRLYLYSTDDGYNNAEPLRAEWRRRSAEFRKMSMEETLSLEPALAPAFKHAVYLPGASSVTDPKALVMSFASAFESRGGVIHRERVDAIRSESGSHRVVTDKSQHRADVVVIAAGAWSKPLCSSLGLRVPLETERGYHAMLDATAPTIARSVMWADRYIHLVPIGDRVRLASGVELAGLAAKPDYRRIRRLARRATELVPGLDPVPRSEWVGFRPSLPDSLPIIGQVPRHRNVIACFGHHHLGLTLGPISGRLVAELVGGRTPAVDLSAFRPDRPFV